MAKRKDHNGRRKKQSRAGWQAGFQHHQQVFVESLERLLDELGSSCLTWSVIGIALALPLFLMLLLQNLQQLGSGVEDANQISLYMNLNLSNAELANLQTGINSRADVASVTLISAEEALEEFQGVSGFGDALTGLESNPLPAVLLIKPASNAIQDAELLLADVTELDEVDFAQFDMEWVQRLNALLALAQRLILILAVLLCGGVILVVGNTIRMAIENRQSEILVVKLVGGTNAYVARPFLYTGLWYGIGGGIIASILVIIAQFSLQGSVSSLAGLYQSSFDLTGLSISNMVLVLLGSGLLGWMGAWVSVLRYLKSIEPS